MKVNSALYTSAITLILLQFVSTAAVYAAGEEAYKQGVKDYKGRDFRSAAEHFRKSIVEGNASAHTWLYMAHSYAAAGDKLKAYDAYKRVERMFSGKPAGQMAAAGIKKLGNLSSLRNRNIIKRSSGDKRGLPKSTNPDDWRSLPFKDRVIIYPANEQFGHPEVSKATEEIVRRAILTLPNHFYRTLEKGGVTVTIVPNIIDKWPDMVKNNALDKAAQELAKVGGRCYDRDVHIWQNGLVPGTLKADEAQKNDVLLNSTYHELGHAYDDCLGTYSQKSEAIKLYKADVEAMPPAFRKYLIYFAAGTTNSCSEACAELTAELLGSKVEEAKACAKYFPKLRKLVREKTGL